jgi:hypothetical protein
MSNKETRSEGRRKEVCMQYGHTVGRGGVSTAVHLSGSGMSFNFKQRRNCGWGREVCINFAQAGLEP